MPRYKMVNGERVQLTAEEEAARDAEEAAWEDGGSPKLLVWESAISVLLQNPYKVAFEIESNFIGPLNPSDCVCIFIPT